MESVAGAVASAIELLQYGGLALWWRIAGDLVALMAALGLAAAAALVTAVALARARFPGRALVIALVRCSLFMPTVLLGLGALWLLQERWVTAGWTSLTLVLAILAWPMLVTLLMGVLRSADPRARETAITLGASPLRAALAQLRDVRPAVRAALLVTAGRLTAEAGGAAVIWRQHGPAGAESCAAPGLLGCSGPESLALGMVLLVVALVLNLAVAWREARLETRGPA